MKTRASRSEKIVSSMAVAVLLAGFASGVFAEPKHARPHTEPPGMHIPLAHERDNEGPFRSD